MSGRPDAERGDGGSRTPHGRRPVPERACVCSVAYSPYRLSVAGERAIWFMIAVANGEAPQSRPRALASAVAAEAITLSSCAVLSVLRLVNTERIIGALDPGDQTIARSLAVP